MRILMVGGKGTIGTEVRKELAKRHEILTASKNSGEVKVDITSVVSVTQMYDKVGKVDAVVATAGDVHFGSLQEMNEEQFYVGIRSKMMGQLNLVLTGQKYLSDGGSFTLTSGILTRDPIRWGASASAINGAVESFALAASIELARGQRINVVSPGVVELSAEKYGAFFPGHVPVSMTRVVAAYCKSVEGAITGKIIEVF